MGRNTPSHFIMLQKPGQAPTYGLLGSMQTLPPFFLKSVRTILNRIVCEAC